jgi:hypothetical protein
MKNITEALQDSEKKQEISQPVILHRVACYVEWLANRKGSEPKRHYEYQDRESGE